MNKDEALRLADFLECNDACLERQREAAAELRRLHAENEKFRKHIEGQNDELDKLIPMAERLEAENECLHQIVAQRDALLEALKTVVKEFKKYGRQHWPEAVKAQAAIDKVEEGA